MIQVRFNYITGLVNDVFTSATLQGSWDQNGYYSQNWSSIPMQKVTHGPDGSITYTAAIQLDESQVGINFYWGVRIQYSNGNSQWGITDENDESGNLELSFRLSNEENFQEENYYITHCRRLGSNKRFNNSESPSIQFSVWAPNARAVEVVFGNQQTGYIANDGNGIIENPPPIPLERNNDGIWNTNLNDNRLSNFNQFDHLPYMYRITKDDGTISYRTDLYSRCQIGKGNFDPKGSHYEGSYLDLDGSKGCSVIINPETVTRHFEEPVWPETQFIPQEEFWADEFDPNRPLPTNIDEIVIYELHVGALGFGKDRPGNLQDAIDLLDYLQDLGVNAIELLPMNEFEGWAAWGYGSSHFFAVEYSYGGRDQFKFFVKACHQRGIAVILDVVYNHYLPDGERAEWMYDSNSHQRNMYYWYEGNPSDYRFSEGGYIDNMSTGYAPNYRDRIIRKMFISSAASIAEEFHVDGFRLDQTTSIHSYNVLHADGRPMGNVNIAGARFLREFNRTLNLIKPGVFLTAEDHSGWYRVTQPTQEGGLGFDAAWYADFYHHLIGDPNRGNNYAKLLYISGFGGNSSLNMDYFAGALSASADSKVVYHECHDEAGNSEGSARTMVIAVNHAPLIGTTRFYAEARSRLVFGLSMTSAGIPLFLMGEEVAASNDYTYNNFMNNREDLYGERQTTGRRMFEFYQDLIRFKLSNPGLCSRALDIIHVHNDNRVIAFRRWNGNQEFLIAASFNNNPFSSGYLINNIRSSDGTWQEIFNSDSRKYGGSNIGNEGARLNSINESINIIIPANGFVIFQKTP